MYKLFVKRSLDLMISILIITITSPIMVITYLLIWMKMGKPCVFTQLRPGQNNQIFKLYKFRTMSLTTDQQGSLLGDAQRLTPLGKRLRQLSIDELPQLFNVVKGDMSLIGPRPLLPEYLPRYSKQQSRRHEVRPGITGYAQVHGRNAISWPERLNLDVWYVDHLSFWEDLKILWQTVRVVIKAKNTHAAGHVTMPKFTDWLDTEKSDPSSQSMQGRH